MYCSECKLRVADDSVVICPVCQGVLQSDSEAGEKSESVDFVDELAAVFEPDSDQDSDQDFKLDDKLDAYVRDDASLNFDPEVLGLKSTEEDDPAASADDIRVLADLWEKEDIGADLEGVFADAFNLEKVDPVSPPADQVVMQPEKAAPETPVMSTPVMSTSGISTLAPAEKSRNLGLPLLIFVVLVIAAGGGWFYMQNADVKSENKLTQEIKSPLPAPVTPPVKPQPKPAVVDNKPLEDKAVPVVEKSTVAAVEMQPARDETAVISAVENRDSFTDVETGAAVPEVVGSVAIETVAADSPAATLKTLVPAASEPLIAASSAPVSMVENKTRSEPVTDTAVENQPGETPSVKKGAPESIVAKEKAVAGSDKVNLVAAPAVTAAGPHYVVHIGSFRNEAGADRQLAKMHKKGFAAYKVEVDLGAKGVWQRIFVPGGVLKSEARQVQEQLAKMFPREDSLVRKIKK